MRLIFVRHGEPDYENDCLTENGREQARCTAERLRKEKISAIYSSPNGRARETASFTAEAQGIDDIRVLDFMHEIDWGDSRENSEALPDRLEYDGHPWTLAYKLLTEEQGYQGGGEWQKHHYFRDNKCLSYYSMISEAFDGFLSGFGLVRRNGVYFCEKSCEDTIALFAHGGSGAVMFSHILGLPFPYVLTALPYGVCSVSIIEFSPQEGKASVPRLELFNDMGHIESCKQEKLHFDK